MKQVFASLLLAGLFIAHSTTAAEPLLSIGPKKVILMATSFEDQSGWRQLQFTLTNWGRQGRYFNRFCDCWVPILLSSGFEIVPFGGGRDATRPLKKSDFPFLRQSRSTTVQCGCRVVRNENGLLLVVSDLRGGSHDIQVKPGNYKICIKYNNEHATPYPGFVPTKIDGSEVWAGWTVSNWIDLTVQDKKK